MSLEAMFDHVCNVWRLSEAVNELREKVNTYTRQVQQEKLAIAPPQEARVDLGAGDVNVGTLRGFARRGADIQDEDILEVIRGPESPVNLRVLTHRFPNADRLRYSAPGHHMELSFERWRGSLE